MRWFSSHAAARLALAFTVVGCATVSAPPASTPRPTLSLAPTSAAAPTGSASPAPTPSATTTAPRTAPPSSAPPCASETAGEPQTPPDASLKDAGGIVVTGSIGSYTYCGTAADALPPKAKSLTPVALGSPATAQISVEGGQTFTAYRATYWPAGEWQGDEIALARATLPAQASTASFPAPPNGDWMLAVNVTFTTGDHSLYYWHVTVP